MRIMLNLAHHGYFNLPQPKRHLLSIEHLKRKDIEYFLQQAHVFAQKPVLDVRRYQSQFAEVPMLMQVFFENSTRTRTSFDIAAHRLGLRTHHLSVQTSSVHKGESLTDTIHNLSAMGADLFVMRHNHSGAAHAMAYALADTPIRVVNAGDGQHAHPTQALLDMYTIWQHAGDFTGLSVAIVGDVLHSRVARSNIFALGILGCPDIRVIGPRTLLPRDVHTWGVRVFDHLHEGLLDVDVVMTLRLQKERMSSGLLPSMQAYHRAYGVTLDALAHAKPHALVMHPGPMNRGVEIDSAVADGAQSCILKQVEYGVYVRMAVMDCLLLGSI